MTMIRKFNPKSSFDLTTPVGIKTVVKVKPNRKFKVTLPVKSKKPYTK